MIKSAAISRCGTWRYGLVREWSVVRPRLGLIMLNPSAADAEYDDPTVSASIMLAKRWGFGSLAIGNLFAFRSPSTAVLFEAFKAGLAVGPDCDFHLRTIIHSAQFVMVGWGGEGKRYIDRVRQVDHLIHHMNHLPMCVGVTANGHPKHPLLRYHTAEQKRAAILQLWKLP